MFKHNLKFSRCSHRKIFKLCFVIFQNYAKKGLRGLLMRVRSSHSLIFFKTGVLRNFKTFTGKYLCWSLFLFFIKKRLQHRCFSVKIAKLRNSFFIERLCLLLPESSISLEWTIYANTVLKNEVSHKGFSQYMWQNLKATADLLTFTEEIFYGKLHFLSSVNFMWLYF